MKTCCEEAKARNTKKHDYTYINNLLLEHLTLISVNSLKHDQIAHYYNKLPIGKHHQTRYHIFQHFFDDISKCESKILEHLKVSNDFKTTFLFIQNSIKTNGCSGSTKSVGTKKSKPKRRTKTQQYLLDRQQYERERCQAISDTPYAVKTITTTPIEDLKHTLQDFGIHAEISNDDNSTSSYIQKQDSGIHIKILSDYNAVVLSNVSPNKQNSIYRNSRSVNLLIRFRVKLRCTVLHCNTEIIKLSHKIKVAAHLCILDSGENGIISDFYARHEVTVVDREPRSGVGLQESWISQDPRIDFCSYRALQNYLTPGNRSSHRSIVRFYHHRLENFVSVCQTPSLLRDALDIDEVAQLARHRRRRK